MNITLRKASALQNSINDVIKQIDIKSDIVLTEFHNVSDEISQASAEVAGNILRKIALINALYAIRASVAVANHQVVDGLLTNVARIDKQIQLYSSLAASNVVENLDVINGKLQKFRDSDTKSRVYGFGDTVTTSVLTKADLAGFKKIAGDLKKQKQRLQDEILEANVRTEIVVDETTCNTLRLEGLI